MAHLTHPDSGQEIEVRADQVQLYTSQGWQQTKASKKSAKAEAPETE